MISDESIELDSKVIHGAEDNHKDSGNRSCAAESSNSFLSCSERESMTTNQDANNQEIKARKLLAVKLVREAIKRILLPKVQDHLYNQSATISELCNEENSNESDTKNEECDKAYKLDEGSITRENIDTGCDCPPRKGRMRASTSSDKGSIEIDEFGDSNDDYLRGTSSTISNLGNDAEDEDGTYRKQLKKQKHISMWHLISQHILSDVVSKIGNEQLDEINNNKTLAETNTDKAVSQILTTPTINDSSNTQSVTNDIVQDEEPPKTNHTDGREQNNFVANNTIIESKLKPPKSKNWSKLKKLILLKRSIKVLERARKVNPQPLNFCPEPAPYTVIQSFASRLRQKSG
ncbi:hypothetical protein R3W88_001116 [Solanum pinnatisectum]|uniref:Uncharacterized protein n=1 Tax=Solanum pinnatisectum TaxID=50273 RepID=A0AAV9MK86_9SOLN|nr:hypothetical protein R3W88_001116 [Solanum pinnatisectum]